jgi:hypothetical protein
LENKPTQEKTATKQLKSPLCLPFHSYRRQRTKTTGYMLYLITVAIGFAGWYLWKWYALPISIVIAVLFSSLYSIIEAKHIQKRTDLNIDGQEMAFSDESAVASLEPTTRDPEEYRAYIDSLPEDESDEKNYDDIWSRAKKIEVVGPDFFGRYSIYVDPKSNVAIFLPKSNKTLHIFIGDIYRANRWIVCDIKGLKVIDKTPPEEAYQWKINPRDIWYGGTGLTGLPPGKSGYKGEVLSFEDFIDEINDEWLDIKIKEYMRMMGST